MVLSDFGNSAQGALGANPLSLTMEPSGQILVAASGSGTDSKVRCSV